MATVGERQMTYITYNITFAFRATTVSKGPSTGPCNVTEEVCYSKPANGRCVLYEVYMTGLSFKLKERLELEPSTYRFKSCYLGLITRNK